MAALAGIDLNGGNAGRPDALGVEIRLLVAFDDRHRPGVAEVGQGPDQKRGLAGTGAGHEVERQGVGRREELPVDGGEAVVLRQYVLFDLDEPAGLNLMVVVMTMMGVAMMMVAVPGHGAVGAGMLMLVAGVVIRSLDPGFAGAAAADRTHHETSSSSTRNSSPPTTIN